MDFGENKTLASIIVVLLLMFAAAVFFYNRTLNDLAGGSCSDSSVNCPHEKIVETQNIVIAVLIGVLIIVAGGLAYVVYRKKKGQIEAGQSALHHYEHAHDLHQVPQEKKPIDKSKLDDDEKKVISILESAQGSTFQYEMIKRSGFSKVKVSRVLDKLEQKGLIERKRRGMANLVVIK